MQTKIKIMQLSKIAYILGRSFMKCLSCDKEMKHGVTSKKNAL
ncbi:hypothetical protein CLFO_39540 [Clostridium formicaceticum]|uniref:Uncharacterized protein n=1 Tax=Clostridium formicaceticum TaxID=1497 RepID=A0AAC9WHY4_9CLOT|nr:hypothetical protein CLFO_39540 [Clostridium formicaceticum]